mmetsp:Transcript_19718/g.30403  ORF Transcript_19718/g.30403 Transcript_19718/m.30403 type:complete len:269 (+) Transcript_19718:151-957(+)|eukprot:CAMPEP_0195296642 /NCGR_PEP_ID=MMETSP0707-20130614/19905_1 /TAXON_ID=33640 /ORGANISM="Asterionellopsis glacialis, Strain CCMP134" /LENGTH=268 /DNA_ID=CAMNT_0040358213 /DNA_START=116 /DNA_END=922 /DNA_ORIENTATION=+
MAATAAATKNNNDPTLQKRDEEDEDDDEDYVPTMNESDVEDGEDLHGGSVQQYQQAPLLTAKKRKAVDDAFEELFGYPFGTAFRMNSKRSRKTKEFSKSDKQEQILVDIFGPTAAARLIKNSISTFEKPKATSTNYLPPLSLKKETITEVKRFAGKDITVQKVVDPASSSKMATAATATEIKEKQDPKKGIDHVLDQLNGPAKLTTVAKTSSDWDTFKEKEGVEEELEKKAQGKDAYLVKKDFLDRVDQRRFEHEKVARDKERAARGK